MFTRWSSDNWVVTSSNVPSRITFKMCFKSISCGMGARQCSCWYYFVRCSELNNEASGENKVKNCPHFVLMDVVAHMWLAKILCYSVSLYFAHDTGKKSSCMVDNANRPSHVVMTHVQNTELDTIIQQINHCWEMGNHRLHLTNYLVVPQIPSLGLSFFWNFELIPGLLGTPRVGSSVIWLPLMTWNHGFFRKLLTKAQELLFHEHAHVWWFYFYGVASYDQFFFKGKLKI